MSFCYTNTKFGLTSPGMCVYLRNYTLVYALHLVLFVFAYKGLELEKGLAYLTRGPHGKLLSSKMKGGFVN